MATDILTTIKKIAKQLARAQRLQHSTVLEIVARELGKPNWRGLTEAHKQGWRPTAVQIESLTNLLSDYAEPRPLVGTGDGADLASLGEGLVFTRWLPEGVTPMDADEIHGELDGIPFYLLGDDFSVCIGTQGWEISLDQPPSAIPRARRLKGRIKTIEQFDPVFIERATLLLRIRARRMHAEVSRDWPRRATMPDKNGRALHPLRQELSAEWHCLHCDGVHNGRTMAGNLWHCTDCGATPIDIFQVPWWNGAEQTV
ncbi:hypothetical protein [Rhizobium sp. 1399]|uniref:hypothetical protein n=1 Tax=Rhizobium sp. 1399 TaxID=2817758 RepID=UPI002862B172|nr:hypothetical protein [Rhizobium sp. 1399]MDR6667077.1 hypothetical protein [Rhizobium sp. 1399]